MASRYGAKAKEKVERAMHERKRGTLKSGSGKKVKSRKQAIAIGLSEARREGGKAPAPPRKKAASSRSRAKSSRSSASSRTSSRRKTQSSSGRRKSSSPSSRARKSRG